MGAEIRGGNALLVGHAAGHKLKLCGRKLTVFVGLLHVHFSISIKPAWTSNRCLEDSVAALRRVPVPSPDIAQRVKDYVTGLTQPTIRDVGAGEQLTVEWPGAPRQFAAAPHVDLFTMVAFLEPEKFAARLLAAINKAAPPADRDQQIKNLESEIEKLQRMEELLVVSTGAARISGRRPEVVLGCKISSSRGARAA